MMINTASQSAPAKSPPSPAAAAPAQSNRAGEDTKATAAPGKPANAAATDAPAQPQPQLQPFSRWLGRHADSAAQELQAALAGAPDADGSADAAQPTADAAADKASDTAAAQDGAMLAAMAMPLMPLSPAQVAQAVQAAQGAGAQLGEDGGQPAPVPAAGQDAGRGAALPQVAVEAAGARQDGAAAQLALNANGGNGADAQDGGDHAGAQTGASSAATQAAGAAAAPATQAQPAADTVKLAGPPTAWRQSLQEALGERLHLQVGKNVEQAVIRLEPPQLGRIDIAIRHSAGTLEVNISATNGEVLRQLQTVSDNLRSDLSQRQYTEVAVTVAPAPKNNAAPFGDPQQGRGRQQGRDQDDAEPGRALAEAGAATSMFSLGGRD